ncbi:MAG: hypothetical protein ACK5XN_17900 [Bacteroidota bacterium]
MLTAQSLSGDGHLFKSEAKHLQSAVAPGLPLVLQEGQEPGHRPTENAYAQGKFDGFDDAVQAQYFLGIERAINCQQQGQQEMGRSENRKKGIALVDFAQGFHVPQNSGMEAVVN